MFVERLDLLPQDFADFTLVPSAEDRQAWGGLPADVRRRLLAAGEAALGGEWPLLPVTLWLDFTRNGNRTRFEERYFARRRRLNALVMAECVEAKGRFLDSIIEGIFLIAEESGWQLPAHNTYVRDTPCLPLPDATRPLIDLFAAETGALLAVLKLVLGAALDAVSPQIGERIDREVRRRVLEPYLATHFWWMGRGDEPMNNWTAWCTQNVLLAAFALGCETPNLTAIVRKAAGSLDAFLKDYGEDGACEEGALYYRHAGLCLFNALALLSAAAPQAFAPLWQEPKLRGMAEYIAHVHVAGPRYINFADCSAVTERCGAREFLFGKAVGSTLLMDFAARDWTDEEAPDLPEEINLFYRLQAAFTAETLRAHTGRDMAPPDIFYPSIGLMIARDERFVLAAKAGDNGDSHNHNDVGSITLYKGGEPVLIDVGVESYTAKTFSSRRYEIWTMQSAWHNLPTVGGVMQQAGAAFAARDVDVTFTATEASIAMDIAGAYPPEAKLRHYRRTARLLKGQGAEIADEFDSDLPVILSLLLAQTPVFSGASIVVGDLARIDVSGGGTPVLEEVEITDPRLKQAWPERIYRVLVPAAGSRLTLRIA